MFRRRKDNPETVADNVDETATEVAADAVEDVPDADVETVDRSQGPYDVSEVPDDGLTRLDLGGLRVPGSDGMEIRLEVDEATQQVAAVTCVLGDSALQMTAFAAPRTEGIWADVRRQIRGSLAASSTVEEVPGALGVELHATLPMAGPDGRPQPQPVRFLGVDGPRWFLRGLVSGRAARDRAAAEPLEAVFRATVVVRGTDPMAPGDAIALAVPAQVPEGMSRREPAADRAPMKAPERGPEITEIR